MHDPHPDEHIVNIAPTPLASWAFSVRGKRIRRYDEATLNTLASLTADALAILGAHSLLVPEAIELTSWRAPLGGSQDEMADAPDTASERVAVGPTDLDVSGLERLVADATGARQSFPEQIHVSGSGIAHIGGTELAVADLVRLRGHAFFECGVHVSTAADIWLPHDLRAQEQWDVYEANAPRLKDALIELAALPGVSVGFEETTRYAVVKPDGILNHIDRFGRAVPVLDDH